MTETVTQYGRPLRITGGERREVRDAFEELGVFDVAVFSQVDSQIVRVNLQHEAPEYNFPRDLLMSRRGETPVVTMSGYLFDGQVDVNPWQTGENTRYIRSDLEKERVRITSSVEMEQVNGFDRSVKRHRDRIGGEAVDFTLEDAITVYNAITDTIPRW